MGKILGAIVVIGIGIALVLLLLDGVWYRFGAIAALVFIFALFAAGAYFVDRRQRALRRPPRLTPARRERRGCRGAPERRDGIGPVRLVSRLL